MNERQYRITKTQAEKFALALKQTKPRTKSDPLLRKLETDALRSQLQELEEQIQQYESLCSGRCGVIHIVIA